MMTLLQALRAAAKTAVEAEYSGKVQVIFNEMVGDYYISELMDSSYGEIVPIYQFRTSPYSRESACVLYKIAREDLGV